MRAVRSAARERLAAPAKELERSELELVKVLELVLAVIGALCVSLSLALVLIAAGVVAIDRGRRIVGRIGARRPVGQ